MSDGERSVWDRIGVYTIAEGRCGPTKIGITSSGKARFEALQSGNPRALEAGCMLPCQYAADIERRVHARLAEYRMQGEWFNVTLDEAESAIDAVIAEGCGP